MSTKSGIVVRLSEENESTIPLTRRPFPLVPKKAHTPPMLSSRKAR